MAIRSIRTVAALILAAVFVSCRPAPPALPGEAPEWIRVYFSPRDHLPDPLVGLIDSAQDSVWAAFYSLGLPEVAEALVRAADRGAEVRVIMDRAASRPALSMSHRLAERGLLRTDYSTGDLMHNKFVVIDGFITWTGSYNPGYLGTYRDDNNAVAISSLRVAERYRRRFEKLWDGRFGRASPPSSAPPVFEVGGVKIEVYFSPGDDCAGRIIELVSGAEKSVHFATFVFTHLRLAEALLSKHQEGVEVRGVMERGQAGPWSCFRLFQAAGMDVVWDRNPHYLHHKFFVIDEKTVITGSFNPSRAAETGNDENVIIVHHPAVAELFREEFERLR